MELDLLREKKVAELREIGKALKIPGVSSMKKKELLDALVKMAEEAEAAEAERVRAEEATKKAEEKPASAEEAPSAEDAKEAPKAAKSRTRSGRGRSSKKKAEEPVKEEAPAVMPAAGPAAAAPAEEAPAAPAAEAPAVKAEDTPAAKAEEAPAAKAEEAPQKRGRRSGGRKKASKEPAQTEQLTLPLEEQPAPEAEKPAPAKPERKTADKPARRGEPGASEILRSSEHMIVEIEKTGEPEEKPQKPAAEAPAREEAPQAQQPAENAAELREGQEQKKPENKEKPKRVYELKDGRFETKGVLEVVEQGYGFLRFENFMTSDQDIFVNQVQIRRFNLKTGDMIECIARPPAEGDRFGALLFVKTVNGDEPGKAIHRKDFSELTPIYPDRRIVLEKGSAALSMRMTDLVAPIGFGQRGLIVAPPKAGKTTILKQIAQSIEKQGIDAELIVLLIDERPEEVTDMKRSINGEVIYSTFDEQPQHHVKVAEMVLARAQRLVEHGKDVIILLDSITRLSRAYNLVEPPSGRTLSGGLDPAALYKPKKFFGAARNMEEGGSITILATALIETGSRMDDMIFEEFKGTGNMEIHLDRKLSEKRIFPAINLNKSGTRREDMLMSPDELEAVWMMRRAVADMGIQDATEKIVFELVHTRKNSDFVERFRKIRL
ncbi:MAG: transcription termination factor Rho [Firmicutes bacterium]|nr:transcription termination factor Rho [Bacillota bacterium]